MSAYSASPSSYPHHPAIHGSGSAHDDSLAAQHGMIPQPYQYNSQPPPQQQHGVTSYSNGLVNGNTEDGQQSAHGSANGEPQGQKGNRLRKACDSCSIRKVKCDESGVPCRACAALEIPCTFDRPSRRRGPPNRHAEAIKKRKLEDSPSMLATLSPSSPNNVAATLASFSSHAVLNAESICPFSTLELLVDDFFTYIHPLAPFPHEPSFRAAFQAREDLKNPGFLALLASMVGMLVASFPRRPRLHLKAQRREHLFPTSLSLVDRCHKIAVEARGAGYLDKELSIYDACTSYFLGLAAGYTLQWKQCRLYFGETLNISRLLGAHKVKDAGYLSVGSLPATFGGKGSGYDGQPQPVDCIKQEIGRRIFWVMVVGIRSLQQLGATFGELFIPPATPNDPYPPYPAEVDDEYIFVSHIGEQPPGLISKLTAFNLGIRIYTSTNALATLEMCYGIDEVFDWNRQKKILEDALRSVKAVLDSVPQELMLTPGPQPGEFASFESDRPYFPPMADYPGNGNGLGWPHDGSEARRRLQYEIQKANIYASQLGTRSYIVEKYGNLQEAYNRSRNGDSVLSSPGAVASGLDRLEGKTSGFDHIETNVANEREIIVKDLLRVLGSISQVNMEPNGGSFINKIRQIASTLIGTPQDRKGPLALKSEEYLARFLDVLMKLERISPALKSEMDDVVEDEEEELRNWADLRDYQMRFAQSGGFLNDN